MTDVPFVYTEETLRSNTIKCQNFRSVKIFAVKTINSKFLERSGLNFLLFDIDFERKSTDKWIGYWK